MIVPILRQLTPSIVNSIYADKIIYAEVTPNGAMGNSGGVIIYTIQGSNKELIRYETNIYDDQETYLLADAKLCKHLDKENENNGKEDLYFDYYYGGMGNNVFINKKANLSIQDNYLVYQKDGLEFQIYSSVRGVFNVVVTQLNEKKNSRM